MKKGIIVFLLILAGLSFLLPDVTYALGEIGGISILFRRGYFILLHADFTANIGVFFLVAIITAILGILSLFGKLFKKIFGIK